MSSRLPLLLRRIAPLTRTNKPIFFRPQPPNLMQHLRLAHTIPKPPPPSSSTTTTTTTTPEQQQQDQAPTLNQDQEKPPSSSSSTTTTTTTTTTPEQQQGQAPTLNQDQHQRKRPNYFIIYTCKPCGNRSGHTISKQAYHHGSCLITCSSCTSRHVISDHLGIFGDEKVTVEDILRKKGELVRKGTLGPEGDLEFWVDEKGRKKSLGEEVEGQGEEVEGHGEEEKKGKEG